MKLRKWQYSLVLLLLISSNITYGEIIPDDENESATDILKETDIDEISMFEYPKADQALLPSDQRSFELIFNQREHTEKFIVRDLPSQTTYTKTKLNQDQSTQTTPTSREDYLNKISYVGLNLKLFHEDEVHYSYVSSYWSVKPTSQMDTGLFSNKNCVPAVTSMLYNWSFPDKPIKSVQTMRNEYPPGIHGKSSTSGYTISDINTMYSRLGFNFTQSNTYKDVREILPALAHGNLVSLIVDTSMLQEAIPGYRIGHTYKGGGQHNVICTGYLYLKIDGLHQDSHNYSEKVYLEVIDPADDLSTPRYYDARYFKDMLAMYNLKYFTIYPTEN